MLLGPAKAHCFFFLNRVHNTLGRTLDLNAFKYLSEVFYHHIQMTILE